MLCADLSALSGSVGVATLSDAFPRFPYPFDCVCFPYPFDVDLYFDELPLSPLNDFPFDHPLLPVELLELDLSLCLRSLYACIDLPVWFSSSCKNEHLSPYMHSFLSFHDGQGGGCQNLHVPFGLLHENVKKSWHGAVSGTSVSDTPLGPLHPSELLLLPLLDAPEELSCVDPLVRDCSDPPRGVSDRAVLYPL